MARIIVFVLGHPASGKTTLAARLGLDLKLVALHRDSFKEVLFDTWGSSTVDDSKALGPVSYALMHSAARAVLASGQSVILESNDAPIPGRAEALALCRDFEALPVEVLTDAPAPVLATRFRRRLQDGSRHPGHHDAERLMEWMNRIQTPFAPLNLSGPLLRVDTSAPDGQWYPLLLSQLKALMER